MKKEKSNDSKKKKKKVRFFSRSIFLYDVLLVGWSWYQIKAFPYSSYLFCVLHQISYLHVQPSLIDTWMKNHNAGDEKRWCLYPYLRYAPFSLFAHRLCLRFDLLFASLIQFPSLLCIVFFKITKTTTTILI
eukprot:gene8922-6258_t